MVVFSFVFGRLAGLPSEGIPYPLFVYAGLLPWQFFSGAFARVSGSVVSSSGLINKVYFPRLVSPLSAVASGLADFGIAFLILLGMMVYYHAPLTPRVIILPLLLLLAMAIALSGGLWLAVLNVRFRDIGFMVPFLLQVWLYLSPVAYSTEVVPEQLQNLYNLNPMTLVVGGFRWALLGVPMTLVWTNWLSLLVVALGLVGGLFFFQQRAQTFADVI
jgi:lipopolysaccharide transport system permease protein